MSSIDYTHDDGDGFVTEEVETSNQVAEIYGHLPYRVLYLSLVDEKVNNDGTDTETVTLSVVDGLEVARGTDPADASVLDYSGEVVLRVDGAEVTRTATDGTASVDVTTEKPAGATIEVEAETLADHPAESDAVAIEVVSG